MTDPATTDRTAPGAVPGELRPMKPSEALRKARQEITPEGTWTQGWNARNEHGQDTSVQSAFAICFCAEGAILRATGERWFKPDRVDTLALNYLRQTVKTECVHDWNDDPARTHAEVLDAFTRAITFAEAEENSRATEQGAGDA